MKRLQPIPSVYRRSLQLFRLGKKLNDVVDKIFEYVLNAISIRDILLSSCSIVLWSPCVRDNKNTIQMAGEGDTIDEQVEKLREHVPDDKTDRDIRGLIETCGDNKVNK